MFNKLTVNVLELLCPYAASWFYDYMTKGAQFIKI